ncbi:MAG TPA: hypothetical protein PK883_08100 [Anaerolineaceae bacterium]|nr:hypothetical protein [Anaerolineaceae bacterium]
MPAKLRVPLEQVQAAVGGFLVLDHPPRCSRCGAQPAAEYETHKLRLRMGAKKPGLYRQTYQYSRVYHLRVRVCPSCYQADFAANPEEFEKDNSSLGRLARLYNRLYTIGAIIAAVGLVLMTNLVPAASSLGALKPYWPYITGPGMLLVFGAWFHHRVRSRRILETLAATGYDPALHPRASVATPVLENDLDPQAVPLEITFSDTDWAVECAARYNLSIVYESQGDE